MNWSSLIEMAKNESARAHNATASPTPPLTIGDAARLITVAARAQPGSLHAWDWFPPALAALGYRKAGDKFPPASDGKTKLLAADEVAYVWTALDNLAVALDNANIAVNSAWLQAQLAIDPVEATKNLEGVAWQRLQIERQAGHAPSWTPGDANAGVMPDPPVQAPADAGASIPPQPDPTKIPTDKLPRPDKPVTDLLDGLPSGTVIVGAIALFIWGPSILRALLGGRD